MGSACRPRCRCRVRSRRAFAAAWSSSRRRRSDSSPWPPRNRRVIPGSCGVPRARSVSNRDDASPAVDVGLVELGARVLFRHPLVRSAAYRSATELSDSAAHRALADAIDPDVDPDRTAWHRAQAASGPDETIALELERSAARAQRRGGLAAAAAFLERAVVLTADPSRRFERTLQAAEAKQDAGEIEAARRLLALVEASPADASARARVTLVRGRMAFLAGNGSDAPRLLVEAARDSRVTRSRAREPDLPPGDGRREHRRHPGRRRRSAGGGEGVEGEAAVADTRVCLGPGARRPGAVRHRGPGRRRPDAGRRRSPPSAAPTSLPKKSGGSPSPSPLPACHGTRTAGTRSPPATSTMLVLRAH